MSKEDDDEKMLEEKDSDGEQSKPGKLFTLKKWNLVGYWSWDCSSDTCAICRVQVGLGFSISTN